MSKFNPSYSPGPIWKRRYFKVVPPPEEFQEITVSADDEYNPLDVLDVEGRSHGAELESVDVDEVLISHIR
jgi:hypothetical protein